MTPHIPQPHSTLQCTNGFSLYARNSHEIDVAKGDHAVTCTGAVYALLAAFARPAPMLETLRALRAQGHDWDQIGADLFRLYNLGVIHDVTDNPDTPLLLLPVLDSEGFGSPHEHIAMLSDEDRTATYLAAIRAVVRPGDTVIDLGTGSGVLAVGAAQAGAGRVYAIESSGMAELAARVFAANGLADRVTLVRGRSTQITPPEPADVLVSEIIGSEPLGEEILTALRDAKARFVKPGARMIPVRLRIYAQGVTIPARKWAERRFTPELTAQWADAYGVNFDPLADMQIENVIYVPPGEAFGWAKPTPPALMAEIDFRAEFDEVVQARVIGHARADGLINGVMVYFEADLTDDPAHRLTTNPEQVDDRCSWDCAVWMIPGPFDVRAGDQVELGYGYDAKAAERYRVGARRV
jgi:protein arginine N-methyltransferase 1